MNTSIFGPEYFSSLESITDQANKLQLDRLLTNNQFMNKFLDGGLVQGRIYSFVGQSLSGKTNFINNILIQSKNSLKKKILFIDSGSSLLIEKLKRVNFDFSRIIHIKEILNLTQLLLFFKEYKEWDSISFIIIDSLSLINNKMIKRISSNTRDFNNLMTKLKLKYNLGIIFTSCVSRAKEKNLYFYNNTENANERNKNIKSKDLISNITSGILLAIDYTFTFINSNSEFKIYDLKNRRYHVEIRRENSVNIYLINNYLVL